MPGKLNLANPYADKVEIKRDNIVFVIARNKLFKKYLSKLLAFHASIKLPKYKDFGIKIGGYGITYVSCVKAVATMYIKGITMAAEQINSKI
ncbi:hypothetical protein V7D15_01280 [Thermoanaerobacter thermohydrosulfuricus]